MSRYIETELLKADIRPFSEYESNRSNKDWVRRFENAIDAQPTADVRENVKGEWIEQEDDYYHYWECSECGFGVGLDDIRNYCPNCGADMRGEA